MHCIVHPKWINRDDLLKWMLQQTDDEDMGDKIHIYPRRFYDNSTNEFTRTKTEVVGVDEALDDKQTSFGFPMGGGGGMGLSVKSSKFMVKSI